MDFIEYISPELLILVPVLYLIGMGLKKSEIDSRHIPLILGGVGIILAVMYEIMTLGGSMNAVYMGILQGVLCAGAAVYANQLFKQEIVKASE